MHSVKKLVGLFVLYSIIILGIFVIQFRNDFIIRKNIRGMRVTISQNENGGLKNDFKISYGGISFNADENFPVEFSEGGISREAKLISFEESERSLTLNFENEIALIFSLDEKSDSESEEKLNPKNENSTFWIRAKMPENVQSVSMNFSADGGFSLLEQKSKSAIFAPKKSSESARQEFALNAPQIEQNILTLRSDSNSAYYALVPEKEKYSLDEIENIALASEEIYAETIRNLRAAIISDFLNASKNNSDFASGLTEQTVISFLAEMLFAGRYNEGLNAVPQSFVSGPRRTFASTPFFGNLAATLPSLRSQVENFDSFIARSVRNRTLDVFTLQNIAPYMYAHGNRGNVAALASMPASLTELNLNIEQAAGIIRAYIYFREQNSAMASALEPVLELCAKKIMENASLEDEKISIKENDSAISILAAAQAGDALISYGRTFGENRATLFGYFIVNSYISKMDSLDLRMLGEIYPILIHGNNYYPHFELLRTMETGNVWAYTISPNISYRRDGNLTISLNFEFPTGLSHYDFVSGIAPFQRIQIYGMDFRSDARFESYNSSGYIYRAAERTLLLKSLHRNRQEPVQIFYQREIPAAQAQTAAPERSENSL